jgi:putative ABC transport system permease protein
MNALNLLEQFAQDIRFAFRNLARSPGFALMAAGSLALGIGSSAAMYSVVYAVILDPFPYKEVNNLMGVKVQEPGKRGYRSYYTVDQYLEIDQRNTIFDGVIASTISDVVWTGGGDPQRLRGNHVSMNTFMVLGVPPLLGRATTAADALPDAEAIAVLGYRFWQRQFGGDPAVIGRKLKLNDKVRTVVGVMPPRFMWRGADVYLPVVFRRGEVIEGVRDVHVLGRLKPGVTMAQAEADLRPIIQELQRRDPGDFPETWRAGIISLKESFPSGIREALWILFGAVGLLLLIACVNVSNLLLSKASVRQKEISVRAALGAGRGRLVRQLLAEGLVLAIAGGALGIALAYAGLRGIIAMVPPNTIPDEAQIAVNVPVLFFTVLVSVASAILFGLTPALHLTGRDLASSLKESGRGASGGLRQRLLRSGLVLGEIALSLMLLVGASLMIRTLLALQNVELGIRPDRLLTLRVPLNRQRYPDAARRGAFLREVVRRIENLPGVVTVGVNTWVHPLGGWSVPVEAVGNTVQDGRPVLFHQINESYLKAMGIGLVQGRSFDAAQIAGAIRVAIVNQAFVRRYLPIEHPLGRQVRFPQLRSEPLNLAGEPFEVIGVVRDTLNRLSSNETMPEIYIPYPIASISDRLVVLAQGDPVSLVNAVRSEVYAVDPNQPVMDVKTIETMLKENAYSRPRFNLFLFALFAGLGLVLTLFGVYSVLSNTVAQRTRELGIRIAVGADTRDVFGLVLGAGAKLIGLGIFAGLLASLASVRLLTSLVAHVSAFDPYSFAAMSVLLFGAGLLACYWPARRASRLDPTHALRHE